MRTRHHHVEHREDFIGIVERPINMDVHFTSGQKTNPVDPSICFVDGIDVIPQSGFIESIGLGAGP